MIRQYYPARSCGGRNPLRVGVIAVGSIYYLQDRRFSQGCYGDDAVCRTPWIVEAFLNGTIGAARRNPRTGHWESAFISRRSDQAVVRSLRDGRRQAVSVQTLIIHDDEGLWKLPTTYPGLPDVERFYRRRHTVKQGAGSRSQNGIAVAANQIGQPEISGQFRAVVIDAYVRLVA